MPLIRHALFEDSKRVSYTALTGEIIDPPQSIRRVDISWYTGFLARDYARHKVRPDMPFTGRKSV